MSERGVIRFVCRHQPGPAPSRLVLGDLDHWRTRLHDAGLIGVTAEGIGYGNVSVRVAQTNAFVISGSGTGGHRELGAARYARVTHCVLDANLVEAVGPVPPSSESLAHGALYGTHPGVRCVMHVHHTALWRHALGRLPTTDVGVEAGTPEMAEAVAAAVPIPAAMPGCIVMAGHADGLIAFGNTPEDTASILLDLMDGLLD